MARIVNKLLVIEDSRVDRSIIASIFERNLPYCELLFAMDPYEARTLVVEQSPLAILLDLALPRLGGQEFLRCLMRHYPLPVIVVSRLLNQKRSLQTELQRAGVIATIEKPRDYTDIDRFSEQLCNVLCDTIGMCPVDVTNHVPLNHSDPAFTPKLIAIGASTGGPRALELVLSHLDRDCPPVVIAQHIATQFAFTLTDRLNRVLHPRVTIAEHGQRLRAGHVYLAPPGRQMRIDPGQIVAIESSSTNHLYAPSVDVLFNSLAECQPQSTLAVILTGMGEDGALGMLRLHQAGATTIAQDEASSAIFGMPKRAIELGGIDHVMSLSAIGPALAGLSQTRDGKSICHRVSKPQYSDQALAISSR